MPFAELRMLRDEFADRGPDPRSDAVVLPLVGDPATSERVAPEAEGGQGGAPWVIEIYGRRAGVAAPRAGRFVFLAEHPAFWSLDECHYGCIADAEKAVHDEWLRYQHRRGPKTGYRRRS